ncbi:MAG: hypothetical protein AABX14_02725 [Candidatus Aenigmatarchaeota archaeon]
MNIISGPKDYSICFSCRRHGSILWPYEDHSIICYVGQVEGKRHVTLGSEVFSIDQDTSPVDYPLDFKFEIRPEADEVVKDLAKRVSIKFPFEEGDQVNTIERNYFINIAQYPIDERSLEVFRQEIQKSRNG